VGSGGFRVSGICATGHGVHGESTSLRGVVGKSEKFQTGTITVRTVMTPVHRLRACRWTVALWLVVLAVGTSSRSVAQGLGGSWEGQVTQDRPPSTYPMEMELYGRVGTINYPSFGCGGRLEFMRTDGTTYWYRETLTSGLDKCIDGGVIQLSRHPLGDANSWVWRWDGGGVTVRGVIRGSGTPRRN
jgi:hypothetical protein